MADRLNRHGELMIDRRDELKWVLMNTASGRKARALNPLLSMALKEAARSRALPAHPSNAAPTESPYFLIRF